MLTHHAATAGEVYTGLADGRIVRLAGNDVVTVAHVTDQSCQGLWEMSKCGRPLGTRFDSRGQLYTIDAYHGLKKIDVSTGQVTTVLDVTRGPVAGRKVIFVDDFALDEGAGERGGNVYYISDSSAKWPLEFVNLVVVEHETSGRILRYDEDTKQVTVVASGIGFPNGVEITDDREAILYNELNKRRIFKLYIRGPRKGERVLFAENLPGEPDNIRRSASTTETYWVALYAGKSANFVDQDPALDWVSTTPSVRKAFIRLFYHFGDVLYSVGKTLNFVPLQDFGFNMRALYHYQQMYKPRGLVVELDKNGKIIRALHSPDGKTTHLAEAREVIENGARVLYLGSYYNDYLGKLLL